MIEEIATVTAVNSKNITLESDVKSTCSGCQQIDSCGSGQVSKAFPQKKLHLTLTSHLLLTVGDKVIIGLSEKVLLSTAWQVYLLPLIGLFIGALFGQYCLSNGLIKYEFIAIIFSCFSGYLGYLLSSKRVNQQEKHKQLTPVILRKIDKNTHSIEIKVNKR